MVIPHLTGAPQERIDHNFVEDTMSVWQKIQDADKRNYVITACTFEKDLCSQESAGKGSSKAVSAHAYAVISVHEFKKNQ